MKNVWRRSGGFFLIAIWTSLFFQMSWAQASGEDILDKYIDGKIANRNLNQVCSILGTKGVPIGLEENADTDEAKYAGVFNLGSGTVREILSSVKKQDPGYDWVVYDGVVNIFPVRLRDEVLKSFLETRLQRFSSVRREGEIFRLFHSYDGVKTFLSDRQVGVATLASSDLGESYALKNADASNVRELLNRIVRKNDGSGWWQVSRRKDGTVMVVY